MGKPAHTERITTQSGPPLPRIVSTPDTCFGAPRFEGTRLTVESMLPLVMVHFYTETALKVEYPEFPTGGVRALIAEYEANQAEWDKRWERERVRYEHEEMVEEWTEEALKRHFTLVRDADGNPVALRCEPLERLREVLEALRECRYRASAPVTLWADGEPERAWPNERRLVDALVAAEQAVGEKRE